MSARRASATLWFAALYLLATAAAGLFHAPHGESAADHVCHDCCGSAPGDEASPEHGEHGLGLVDHPDHECPVCQFLAQKVLPAACEWAFESRPLAGRPVVVRAADPSLASLLLERTRAPPAAV